MGERRCVKQTKTEVTKEEITQANSILDTSYGKGNAVLSKPVDMMYSDIKVKI